MPVNFLRPDPRWWASELNNPLVWGLQDVLNQRADAMRPPGQWGLPADRLAELENNYAVDNPYFQYWRRFGGDPINLLRP